MRPVGLEPTHPNKRGTGLSFRRVYHSTTDTKASQSRRTTGSYGNTIARPPARAQADNTRPHRNTRHNKRHTKRRGTIPCSPWTVQELNLRPTGCKPGALPSELTVQERERHTHLAGDQPRSVNAIRTRTQTRLVTRTQNLACALRRDLNPHPPGFLTRRSTCLELRIVDRTGLEPVTLGV